MSEVSQPNEQLIDLEEINTTLKKSTPGPWIWRRKDREKNGDDGFYLGDLTHWKDKRRGETILSTHENKHGYPEISAWSEHDANIIANAPEWLRALLEEVKGLEQSVDVWETEAWRAIGELKKTKEALDKCLIGGNSLASVVIGWSLPGGYEEWTYEQASNYFYGKYDNESAYEYYETWLCWKAIREARGMVGDTHD